VVDHPDRSQHCWRTHRAKPTGCGGTFCCVWVDRTCGLRVIVRSKPAQESGQLQPQFGVGFVRESPSGWDTLPSAGERRSFVYQFLRLQLFLAHHISEAGQSSLNSQARFEPLIGMETCLLVKPRLSARLGYFRRASSLERACKTRPPTGNGKLRPRLVSRQL